MQPVDSARKRAARAPLLVVLSVLVLAAILVLAIDWHELNRLLGETRWVLVAPALCAVVTSYVALSAGMVAVGRIVGIRAPTGVLFRSSYAAFALNHVISLGGAAGYSVRASLLQRYGESPGRVLAMTVVHSYLNNVAMLALLPVGMIYLAATHPLSARGASASVIAGAASGIVVVALSAALFSRRIRETLIHVASGASSLILGRRARWFIATLEDFDLGISRSAEAVTPHPMRAALPVALVVVDWVATIVAFWFCLDAVGEAVRVGVLLTGFAVGINAGVVSLVPGGLGVQEGSMAATLTLLGVGFEHAILAAILFRVAYYFIPFVVSLPLYWWLLRIDATQADV